MTPYFLVRFAFYSIFTLLTSWSVLQAQQQVTIMPMGDSITEGVDYYTNTLGGYRDPLSTSLQAAGIAFQFVGIKDALATPALIASGQQFHNGFGSWHIQDLDHNLDGAAPPVGGGETNLGGYLLTGGHGTGRSAVSPDLLLLQIGTNDILQQTPTRNADLLALVQHIHTFSPATRILVAGIPPINAASLIPLVTAYNSFIRDTLVPSLPYTSYVDQNSGFLLRDGTVNASLLGTDLVHPNNLGYPVLASVWAKAIAQILKVPQTTASTATSTSSSPSSSSKSAGTTVGTYSFDSKSATQGNSIVVAYGLSQEGGTLVTYWGPSPTMKIVSMGNSQYEIAETLGNRCLTAASTVTINQCTGAANQLFTFTLQSDQTYKIQLASATTSCLSSPGAFSPVQIATCAAAPTNQQSWTINGLNLNPGAAVYSLTVSNGSGTGTYAAGTAVTITASTPPAGMQFSGWTGDTAGLADTTAATTVETVSGNTSLKANYVAAPATATQTVSSSPAAGTTVGTYSFDSKSATQGNSIVVAYGLSQEGGTLVTYWGPSPTMKIVSMGNSQYEIAETLGNRCLTAASTVTINQCTGAANQLFTFTLQSDQTYKIQLASATTSCLSSPGAFSPVQIATCAAAPTNQQSWTINGLNLNPGAAVYSLTVSNGSGTGTYAAGTAVTITASTPPAGMQFSGWTGDTAGLADTTAATTVETVSGNTSLKANYVAAPATATQTVSSSPAAGTTVGTYSFDSKSATQGNSIVVAYGLSQEGGTLVTYWGPSPTMKIVSMGNSQYEIAETLGNRCLTAASTVTINQCTGAANQLFTFTLQSDQTYKIQLASATTSCLSSPGAFSPVQIATCAAAPTNQQSWTINGLNLNPPKAAAVVNSNMVPAGYHLTFDDEFQTLSISDTNGASTHWFAHSVQCCLSDTSNPSTPTVMAGINAPAGQNPFSLVSGGGLDIRLQKTNGTWYSGVLATVDQNGAGFAQQYGYFEMKAKFPAGQGTWPAFWLLNQNARTVHAVSAEIDILEAYMQFPTYINTTLHDYSLSGSSTLASQLSQVPDETAQYHTYGMLWTETTMTFFCDGVQLWQTPTPDKMKQPYFPIIDLGLGGGWPTNNTPTQNDMLVQYVRVYSK